MKQNNSSSENNRKVPESLLIPTTVDENQPWNLQTLADPVSRMEWQVQQELWMQ